MSYGRVRYTERQLKTSGVTRVFACIPNPAYVQLVDPDTGLIVYEGGSIRNAVRYLHRHTLQLVDNPLPHEEV